MPDEQLGAASESDRFTTLPHYQAVADTVLAQEEHGFSVEVVDDLDGARKAVLARIPHGSSVMTNTSVTLAETGIADAINDGVLYESARNKMFALDFATQAQQMPPWSRPAIRCSAARWSWEESAPAAHTSRTRRSPRQAASCCRGGSTGQASNHIRTLPGRHGRLLPIVTPGWSSACFPERPPS
jgi:hypothetical protein